MIYRYTFRGYYFGQMVKADDIGPRARKKTFLVYWMDVMINTPMTCLTLIRLQKSDGQT